MTPEELKAILRGVLPVQLVPFTPDGEIDVEGLKENTRFLVDFAQGNGGRDVVILANGSTSECYALSADQQRTVIRTVVEASAGVPVIAGVSEPGTELTVELARYAEQAGAVGLMVMPPYYHYPTREGLYCHYEEIANTVGIGIMLYNNPVVSGSWVPADLLKQIAQLPEVIAIKENTVSITQYYDMIRNFAPDELNLICGLGEKEYIAEAAYRCDGLVSVIGNFAPDWSYQVYEAGQNKDFGKANELLAQFEPYYGVLDSVHRSHPYATIMPDTRQENYAYLAVGKSAMDLVGLRGGSVKLPMIDLTAAEKQMLKAALEEIGLI